MVLGQKDMKGEGKSKTDFLTTKTNVMQQVTGRLTADATVKTLESGQTVVNFSIAENQRYKPKGSNDYVEVPTFFNCSYWISTAIAGVLRKGTAVLLTGRISARPYQTNTGDLAASLDFHASRVEVQAFTKQPEEKPAPAKGNRKSTVPKANSPAGDHDLPF